MCYSAKEVAYWNGRCERHLGWVSTLFRTLRVDAEMTKRRVSGMEPMHTVQFIT